MSEYDDQEFADGSMNYSEFNTGSGYLAYVKDLNLPYIRQSTRNIQFPFALPRSLFRISWVVAAGAWEGGERYKGTSICRYLLDVPFHISPFGVEGGPGRGKLTLRLLRSRGGRSIAHCK